MEMEADKEPLHWRLIGWVEVMRTVYGDLYRECRTTGVISKAQEFSDDRPIVTRRLNRYKRGFYKPGYD